MYVPNTKQLCVLSHQVHPILSLTQLLQVLRLLNTKKYSGYNNTYLILTALTESFDTISTIGLASYNIPKLFHPHCVVFIKKFHSV